MKVTGDDAEMWLVISTCLYGNIVRSHNSPLEWNEPLNHLKKILKLVILTEKRHHKAKERCSGLNWCVIPWMFFTNENRAKLECLSLICTISITVYSLSILNMNSLHFKLTKDCSNTTVQLLFFATWAFCPIYIDAHCDIS